MQGSGKKQLCGVLAPKLAATIENPRISFFQMVGVAFSDLIIDGFVLFPKPVQSWLVLAPYQ